MVLPAPGNVRDLPALSVGLRTSGERRGVLLRGAGGVIDVGANCGQCAKRLCSCGSSDVITSSDPASGSFAALEPEFFKDERWWARREAVEPADGSAVLNSMNSLLKTFILLRTVMQRSMQSHRDDETTRQMVHLNSLFANRCRSDA